MKKMTAAEKLREAIGASKNWGIGFLLNGDDGVLEACREFDAALSTGAGEKS
jgi:hypothetical protein